MPSIESPKTESYLHFFQNHFSTINNNLSLCSKKLKGLFTSHINSVITYEYHLTIFSKKIYPLNWKVTALNSYI